ncbi:MAG: envelope stress response protein PspG, partial [Aeromonas salmonicida]
MLEFIVLMLVLVAMALTGFTVLAMLVVSGVFVLFGALA